MDNHHSIRHSVCPHDCPSTCALDVEVIDEQSIGRIHGAKHNSYTAGVVCEKVARYKERLYHPDRLTTPLRRTGEKGSGEFTPISFDDALDEVAETFLKAEARYGSETVWPYYFAGTMGLVMRDGINRLRHAKNYSGMQKTICSIVSSVGFIAGTGALAGTDPREIAEADLVVIWGSNAVSTQVNLMTHAMRARKQRGAKIAVVDVYETGTMKQADMAILLRPGTDGALAVAIMHVLFRDGYADRDYLAQYTDCPELLEEHLKDKTPEWASHITGMPVAEIESFAAAIGKTPRTYIRAGYGFCRQSNGAVNMHAVTSIAAITGAWKHKGGGAFHNSGAIYHWDKTLIEGLDVRDSDIRTLDQSRIGSVLIGDTTDLGDGPPVTAMLIQNTNPVSVAPEQDKVKMGFSRPDLFTCVHEQFMTETAKMADIILPATMFLEHDDIYQGGGHQHILSGSKIVDAPGQCRSNHDVICSLAKRLGADHAGFEMSAREMIDKTLGASGWGTLDELEQNRWIDCQPSFETSNYINGFAHDDGKYHFRVDWQRVVFDGNGKNDTDEGEDKAEQNVDTRPGMAASDMPVLPDHWKVLEEVDDAHPYRLVTAPARSFLNSTFNETLTSRKREGRPQLFMHPDDLTIAGLKDGDDVFVGNERGRVTLSIRSFVGVRPGVVISEGIWSNDAQRDGHGINSLTSAARIAPYGGAAFHDNKVWVRQV